MRPCPHGPCTGAHTSRSHETWATSSAAACSRHSLLVGVSALEAPLMQGDALLKTFQMPSDLLWLITCVHLAQRPRAMHVLQAGALPGDHTDATHLLNPLCICLLLCCPAAFQYLQHSVGHSLMGQPGAFSLRPHVHRLVATWLTGPLQACSHGRVQVGAASALQPGMQCKAAEKAWRILTGAEQPDMLTLPTGAPRAHVSRATIRMTPSEPPTRPLACEFTSPKTRP